MTDVSAEERPRAGKEENMNSAPQECEGPTEEEQVDLGLE